MNELSEILGRASGALADSRSSWSAADWRTRTADAREVVGSATTSERPLVAVTLPLSLDLLAMLRGAVDGGYSLLLLDPSAPPQRRRDLLDSAEPHVEVDTKGVRSTAAAGPGPEVPGYLAMSSGTTGGPPKGVLTSWASIAAFAGPGAEALDLDPRSTWAEVTHPSYDLAMTNILLAATSGAALHVSGSLADRLRPHAFVRRVDATHVRLAPRFADLVAAAREGLPLRGLRVWGSGGDRLRRGHVETVFAAGAATVVNTYGTSETAGFASAATVVRGVDVPEHRGKRHHGHGTVGSWSTRLEPGTPRCWWSARPLPWRLPRGRERGLPALDGSGGSHR